MSKQFFSRLHGLLDTLSSHLVGTSFARILVGDNMRVLSRNLDEIGDDLLVDFFDDNIDSFSSPVSAVPNALNRWALESRLLDGMGVHDCVNAVKIEIIEHLVKLQAEELEKKREEERKKKLEAAENLGKAGSSKEQDKKDGIKSSAADASVDIDCNYIFKCLRVAERD